MIQFLLLMTFTMLSSLAAAQGVYKCSAGGKTSYADRPCAEGHVSRLPPPLPVSAAAGVALPEANAVATRDARTLVEFEKLRIAREREQARELARNEARTERERQRQVRAASSRRKSCDKLRLRHKWAKEDLARANGKAQDAARRKARRQAEAMAVECPA